MHLRLVDQSEPPPLPIGEALVASARRPGELHDIVTLGSASEAVAAKAGRSRVGVDVAMTLLLELHLLATDCAAASRALPPAPAISMPHRRMSAAEADYLRLLTLRPDAPPTPTARAALPVRLLPRVSPAVIAGAAATVDLEEAIRWELAALHQGRTIGELGLLLALPSGA